MVITQEQRPTGQIKGKSLVFVLLVDIVRYPESVFEELISIEKERVLYARVSTRTQVNDLETQIDFLGNAYPEELSRTLPVE